MEIKWEYEPYINNVRKEDQRFQGILTVTIPIPKTYPNTAMKREVARKTGVFGTCTFKIESDDVNDTLSNHIVLADFVKKMKKKKKPFVVLLDTFYMFTTPQTLGARLTQNEKKTFKGMGQRMLCAGLKVLKKMFHFHMNNAFIYAEVQTPYWGPPMTELVNELEITKTDFEMIQELEDFGVYDPDNFMLAQSVAFMRLNKPLLDYYKNTHGFKHCWQEGTTTMICATVQNVWNHCKKKVSMR